MKEIFKIRNRLRAKVSRFISLFRTKAAKRHALVGPAKLWKQKRDFQIRFLKEMGLKESDYLFEIGCGTLRGGIPIIRYLEPGHYYGFDVRESVIKEARFEIIDEKVEKKKPTILFGPSIESVEIDRAFNVIWSFSVLFHLSDDVLFETLSFVSKRLSSDGAFYANVNIGEANSGEWEGFPVVTRPFDFYREACAKYGLSIEDIGSLVSLGHVTNVHSHDSQRMLKVLRNK